MSHHPTKKIAVKGLSTSQSVAIYFVLFLAVNAFGFGAFITLQEQSVAHLQTLKLKLDQKSSITHDLQRKMGYGNFIHDFKNFVIRGESDYRTQSYLQKIQADHDSIQQDLETYRSLGDLHPLEVAAIDELGKVIGNYLNQAKKIQQMHQAGMSVEEIDKQVVVDDRPAMAAMEAGYQFLEADSGKQLLALQKQDQFIQRINLAVVMLLLILLNIIAFEVFIRRALIKPMTQLHEVIKNSIDDVTGDIKRTSDNPVKGVREVQLLGKDLHWLLNSVGDHLDEVNSIKTVVDQSTSNVMLADNDLNITYMNDAIVTTLKTVEKDIQKLLPHFSTAKLIGQNIDIFHVNPAHQRHLLGSLKSTYTAKLTLGELHLEIIVNPIWGREGERVGFVTEWRDVTQTVRLEKMQTAVEQNLKVMVEKASRGHIGEQIDVSTLDGFVHDLGEQINTMSRAIFEANTKISNVIQGLANGDLTQRVDGQYEGMLGDIKNAINNSLDNLSQINAQVIVSIEHIASDIQATSERNSNVSQRIHQQAASIEDTASTMEEMTAAVRNNAANAQQANELTLQASEKTTEGAEVMTQTIEAMQQIRESSNQIEQIIGLIDSIAFQTNLLALNAAVEAARAGEHGRGFAVVASEVRNLAGKSADAAKEIKVLIDRSVSQVEHGTQLAEQSGDSLSQINQAITHVTEMVGEIASSSLEQSQGIEQLNQAIVSMDKNTQENASLVELSANSTSAIAREAQQLVERMQQFNISRQFIDQAKKNLGGSEAAQLLVKPVKTAKPEAVKQTANTSSEKPAVKTVKPVVSSETSSDNSQEWSEF